MPGLGRRGHRAHSSLARPAEAVELGDLVLVAIADRLVGCVFTGDAFEDGGLQEFEPPPGPWARDFLPAACRAPSCERSGADARIAEVAIEEVARVSCSEPAVVHFPVERLDQPRVLLVGVGGLLHLVPTLFRARGDHLPFMV